MKKRLCAALLAAVMLLLCGCGGTNGGTDASHSDGGDMIIISESYAEEGHYTDSLDNSWAYSYHVPQLAAHTAGARTINDAIDEKFGAAVRAAQSDMAQKMSLGCVSVSWKGYRCGDILSLVVKSEADWEFTDYAVYLYDTARGDSLTTAELLSRLNLEETTFLNALRRSAANAFDAQGSIAALEGTAWVQERSWTVGAENVTAEVMAYAEEDGSLTAILPIGSLAGASWYYKVLPLTLECDTAALTVSQDDVTVTISGGEATLRVAGSDEAYPIGGAWSDYTAGVIAPLGEAGRLYLLLQTSGGLVAYADLTSGLAGGTVCLSPLGGVGEVTALRRDEAANTVFAVTDEGETDLTPLLAAMTAKLPSSLVGAWQMTLPHNAVQEDCKLEISEDGTAVWQEGVPGGECRTLRGSFSYLGITAEGMVLCYELSDEADGQDAQNLLRGTLAVRCDWEGSGLMQLAGDTLLDVSGYVYLIQAGS